MDIPVIALALLDKAQKQFGKTVKGLSREAIDCLKTYHWPGNVRELQNEIQQVLVMGPSGGMIGAEYLSRRVLQSSPLPDAAPEKEFALAASKARSRSVLNASRRSSCVKASSGTGGTRAEPRRSLACPASGFVPNLSDMGWRRSRRCRSNRPRRNAPHNSSVAAELARRPDRIIARMIQVSWPVPLVRAIRLRRRLAIPSASDDA